MDALQATGRLGKYAPDSAHEFTGNAHFFLHQYDKAIAAYELILDPPSWIHAYLAACFAISGDLESAAKKKAAWERSLRHEYGEQVETAWAMNFIVTDIEFHKRPEDIDLLLNGFRKAGLVDQD